MTSTMSMQESGRFGLTSKKIGIGVAIYAVIEAVVAYFCVFAPLYINPVYQKCAEYNAQGIPCIVKLFGKTLASKAEIAEYQIILSLWDTIFNVIVIYLIFTGITLALAFCMYKGMSFAKSYLIAVFGAKHIVGLMALIVPFANMRRNTMIFGIADSVICIVLCLFFILINNDEYIDDMLLTSEQIAAMNKRMTFGFTLYCIFLACMIFQKCSLGALGNNWSLYLGWTGDTSMGHGYTLALLLAVGLVAAIMYIREADWAMFFYAGFGGAVAISNLMAIVFRVIWVVKTYLPMNNLKAQGDEAALEWFANGNGMTTTWWLNTVLLALAFVTSAIVTIMAFKQIRKYLSFKHSAEDKKPAMAVLISAGSIILSFILTIAAVTIWHKELYAGFTVGAMDYMYFFIYGGATLFLALSMIGGYSFSKFGALGLYLLVISNNFISIFSVFGQRAARAAATEGYVGYNYIISGVLFILAIVSCAGIICAFVIKGVNDYMYAKRYS